MTEPEARDLLRQCDDIGGLEAWIAGRPWEVVPGGWSVAGDLQGWRFRLDPVRDGVRVSAFMPGALPAVWLVGS